MPAQAPRRWVHTLSEAFQLGGALRIARKVNDMRGSRERWYTLLGRDGPYQSPTAGESGGHRGTRIYGRLDCPTALRYIARGQYVRHRVFFADEATAVACGYRPCARCMPEQYAVWKLGQADKS